MTHQDEFIDLFEQLLEGTLDEVGHSRLGEMLEKNPDLLEIASRQISLSATLRQMPPTPVDFAETTASHIRKIAEEGEFEFARKVTARMKRQRHVRILAVAAVIALAAVPFFTRKTTTSSSVGSFSEILWERGSPKRTPLIAGSVIEESSGMFRFEFSNGAIAAIEAPMKVRIISDMEIQLDSGRLNAWCPPSAHGFKVRTASADLTDLGTSFGIAVDQSGKSEFLVLDGLVEINTSSESVRLSQGDALQTEDGNHLQSVAFDASAFRHTWPVSTGILATRGAVIPADPDVPEKLRMMEDNDNVLVIPERRNVPFQSPLKAEITQPGTLPGNFNGKVFTLNPLAGKHLSSFLIRYNPVGTVTEEHFLKFEGEVTFDRPVYAIAAQREALENTDAMFSFGEWPSEYRGIELQQRHNPPDSVTLSKDRRTVRVTLYAGASTDEVRVILSDN